MMRTVVALVLAFTLVGAFAPTPSTLNPVTWTPNAYESQLLSYSGQLNTGVFTVPFPPNLSGGTFNISLRNFALYDLSLYKWCVPALLTLKGATNQAYAVGTWATFYMGAEFSFTPGSPSSYDATDRLSQPCVNTGGGGVQKTRWQVPGGTTVQMNISIIALQNPVGLAAMTGKWEISFELS